MNKEKEDARFVEWAKNNGLLGEIDSLTWERKAFMDGIAEGGKQLAEFQERAEFAEGVCAVDGKLIFDLRNKIEQIEQSTQEDLNWEKLYYQSKLDVLNEILENCSGLHHANGSYVLAQIKKMVEAAEACKEPTTAKSYEREVAMLHSLCELIFASTMPYGENGECTFSNKATDFWNEINSDTQATALAYDREVKAKALEELKRRVDSSGLTIVGTLDAMLAELRSKTQS